MTFNEILQALWRRRRLIEISAVVAIVFGLLIVFAQGRAYRATTQVLFSQLAVQAPGGDGLLTQQKLNLVVITYARQVSSPGFVKASLQGSNIDDDAVKIDAEPIQNTSIIEIRATASSASVASGAARTIADSLRKQVKGAQTELPTELATTTDIIAEPKAKFVSADPFFAVLVALVAGLALAATAALIIESE